jgi:deoxyhypusine synthase
MAVKSQKTGVIILGGGFVKHHICNANLMRNGTDFAVYINTGQVRTFYYHIYTWLVIKEFDGSDSGATPDEAVSWGKLRDGIDPIKINADATLVFPLLVAQTFAQTRA